MTDTPQTPLGCVPIYLPPRKDRAPESQTASQFKTIAIIDDNCDARVVIRAAIENRANFRACPASSL